MTRTKLVFTLGPATDRPGVLGRLLDLGMDCARFNFSHGTHEEHARRARRLSREARGRPVARLMDLSGPKLRVGVLPGGRMMLETGSEIRLTPRAAAGESGLVPVLFSRLAHVVSANDPILLDDGLLRLNVLRTAGREVICRVEVGGVLTNHKGINLPKATMALPALTAKDLADLAFGLSLGMDYIGLSFVRHPNDIRSLRRRIRRMGGRAGIIAKIEKPQAIPYLSDIIDLADGVMVARGDLGVEMEPEQVPILQKRIIQLANERGRIVITATQMLQSMIENPSPTRAEASDVANAIFDGTDAVMLSGETAVGRYPERAAAVMGRIAARAEASPEYNRLGTPAPLDVPEGVIVAEGVDLAEKIQADAVIAFTQSGKTARLVSRQRPRVPVIVLAHDEPVRRRLQLFWGLRTLAIRKQISIDAVVTEAIRLLRRHRLVRLGGRIVILASSKAHQQTNFIKMHTVPGGSTGAAR